MRAIFKTSLYKYFRRYFMDSRMAPNYDTVTCDILGANRKACRKRRRYYSHINTLTTRLYWIIKIAANSPDSFTKKELTAIRIVLSNMERGVLYSKIPYSDNLYNKIRKVVHDALYDKALKNHVEFGFEVSGNITQYSSINLEDTISESDINSVLSNTYTGYTFYNIDY